MHMPSTLDQTFDLPDDPVAQRERSLARLADVIQLHAETLRRPAGERVVDLSLLRRVVFAAYRAVVDAGAGGEAARLLEAARRHPSGLA